MLLDLRGNIRPWVLRVAGFALPLLALFHPQYALPAATLGVFGLLLLSETRDAARSHGHTANGTFAREREWRLIVVTGLAALAALQVLPPPRDSMLRVSLDWIRDLPGAIDTPTGRSVDRRAALGQVAALGALIVLLRIGLQVFAADASRRAWAQAQTSAGALAALLLLIGGPAEAGGTTADWSLGVLANSNALAGGLALAAVLTLGVCADFLHRRRAAGLVFATVGFLLCAGVSLRLSSRGAGAALVVGVIVWGVLERLHGRRPRSRPQRWGLLVMAGAVALLALALSAPGLLAEQLTGDTDYRLLLWHSAWEVGQLAPLAGLGFGGFAARFALHGDLLPPLGATFLHPDSGWVLLVVEAGLLGTGILIAMIAATVRAGMRTKSASPPVEGAALWRHTGIAGLVAWGVAAVGDISFQREWLLAAALPMAAFACGGKADEQGPALAAVGRASQRFSLTLLALLAGIAWSLQTRPAPALGAAYEFTAAGEPRLNDAGARALHEHPLSPYLHQQLGRSALALHRAELAARHWIMVARLWPAMAQVNAANARELGRRDPSLAVPLWSLTLRGAPEIRAGLLREELSTPGAPPLRYWRRVIADLPELLGVLAARPEPAAQRAFAAWLERPDLQHRLPLAIGAAAFAQWGTTGTFDAWLEGLPEAEIRRGRSTVETLAARGRADLAWVLARRLLPPVASPPLAKNDSVESLERRLLLDPDDFVALSQRIDRLPPDSTEYRAALRAASARPAAPQWFAVRLAYVEAQEGDFAAACRLIVPILEEQPPGPQR